MVSSDKLRYMLHSLPDANATEVTVLCGGEGPYIHDTQGRRYLDAVSGVWNVSLGYGRADLIAAADAQMRRLAYGSTYAGFANEPALALAEEISKIVYPSLNSTYFTASGADANEVAVKTARYYWHRHGLPSKTKVLGLDHGFYGTTLAMISASGLPAFRSGFGPRLPGFYTVPAPYPYRCDFARSNESPGAAAVRELERIVLAEGAKTIAALIVEPVQGSAGVIVPPDDYLPAVREICNRHDILLISDEIITGFGRTGEWFAMTHWDTEPDIVSFGKGVTSGYLPLGGMVVSDKIADVICSGTGENRWVHSSTFSGHAVSCAVALQVLKAIGDEQLIDRSKELGVHLLEALQDGLTSHVVGEVRGAGLMVGVELVADPVSRAPFDPSLRVGDRVRRKAQQSGVLVRSSGNTINLAPPFVCSRADIETIVDILREAITEVLDL